MKALSLSPHAARVSLALTLRGQPDAEYLAALDAYLHAEGIRNFRAKEVCEVGRLHGAIRLQAAPVSLWGNIIPTLRAAEWLRGELGDRTIRVTSGYRDRAYNIAIYDGKEPPSNGLHMQFNALDIDVIGVGPQEVYDTLERYPMADHMGIGLYNEFDVHMDTRGMLGMAKARW